MSSTLPRNDPESASTDLRPRENESRYRLRPNMPSERGAVREHHPHGRCRGS
jgi:hypothetical protein